MPELSRKILIQYLKADYTEILGLMGKANIRTDPEITYSKNIFLPITNICRNECGYCIYRRSPESMDANILMEPSKVMDMLLKADKHNCHEALFTFGEGADEFSEVSHALDKQGFNSMVDYLCFLCSETLDKTNLLPHSNPGILKKSELKVLSEVNASMGLMLENSSSRLMETIVHSKSPGKDPKLRLKTIEDAGKLKIPFTTGLLIGVGETVEERVDSLLDIRTLQDKYGHIQEIIIQNFKPKPGIPLENQKEPSLMEMVKMVIVSKLLFPDVSIQVPPNLNRKCAQIFLLAGADDWGGVSPLTRDYVNPEAPWPELEQLKNLTQELGFKLAERLPVYSRYVSDEFLSDQILEKIESIGKYELNKN
jgi:FO synthase subunit 1